MTRGACHADRAPASHDPTHAPGVVVVAGIVVCGHAILIAQVGDGVNAGALDDNEGRLHVVCGVLAWDAKKSWPRMSLHVTTLRPARLLSKVPLPQ